MLIILGCMIITLLSPIAGKLPTKVENIFHQNVTIKSGDIMQCEIIKTDLSDNKYSHNYHVSTQECIHSIKESKTGTCYTYYPVSEQCFSFKVKSSKLAHIMLSKGAYFYPYNRIDVILEFSSKLSVIREVVNAKKTIFLSKFKKSSVINNKEYRGFWIRWLDNQLLEVGHESEMTPFLQYRYPKKLDIKYAGLMTWNRSGGGAWIIDGNCKCPDRNGTSTGQKNIIAESDCFILQ